MGRRFLNYYEHDNCPVEPGVSWEDRWSCACNDRCPACNAEIEPYESREIGGRAKAETNEAEDTLDANAPAA